MNNNFFYKVLWIDDDETIIDSTKLVAEDYEIELVHYTNWEEAHVELERNFDEYTAIILDANCKIKADQIENEIFITSILPQIQILFGKKQKDIPWYILSAGTMNQFSFVVESALLSREEKNDEWGNMLYIKGSPEHEKSQKKLFENIKRIAEQKGVNIVLHRYAEIFKYMGDGKLISSKARKIMLKMLCAFYYPEDNVKFEYEANPIRKVVEYLFRAARKVGLLPEECFDDNKSAINISEASLYMSGKNTKHIEVRHGNEKNMDGREGDTILTPRTANALWNVIKFVNAGSHTEEDIILYTNAKDEPYIVDDESKELFFGYVLHLCHIIKSFGEYYEHHSDIMANKAMKRYLNNSSNQPISSRTLQNSDRATNLPQNENHETLLKDQSKQYEGSIVIPKRDEEGIWHYEKCLINGYSGKGQIRISGIKKNKDSTTLGKYPYRASRISLV